MCCKWIAVVPVLWRGLLRLRREYLSQNVLIFALEGGGSGFLPFDHLMRGNVPLMDRKSFPLYGLRVSGRMVRSIVVSDRGGGDS